jgi:hypothetical protein
MIAEYPSSTEVSLDLRPVLHPKFQTLSEGISELTFANLYLFRLTHNYRLSWLPDKLLVISGKDADITFFMLPFGLPDEKLLRELFGRYRMMKTVSESQAMVLSEMGHSIIEDRDNFDYLYSREQLVNLTGRKFHKKRNLISTFMGNNECQAKPLLEEYRDEALDVLEQWKTQQTQIGDYSAAKEALEKMWPLQLCGGIFYIEGRPVAYCLGEELAQGKCFVIHFEKAVTDEIYRGIYQFINQAFASILPEKYDVVNREQDLGILGLRQSKESYNPLGFVKKYKAT